MESVSGVGDGEAYDFVISFDNDTKTGKYR